MWIHALTWLLIKISLWTLAVGGALVLLGAFRAADKIERLRDGKRELAANAKRALPSSDEG